MNSTVWQWEPLNSSPSLHDTETDPLGISGRFLHLERCIIKRLKLETNFKITFKSAPFLLKNKHVFRLYVSSIIVGNLVGWKWKWKVAVKVGKNQTSWDTNWYSGYTVPTPRCVLQGLPVPIIIILCRRRSTMRWRHRCHVNGRTPAGWDGAVAASALIQAASWQHQTTNIPTSARQQTDHPHSSLHSRQWVKWVSESLTTHQHS